MTIGLTGSFATGKTTVAGIFRRMGARVIDADALAHDALKPGAAAYRKTVKIFGKGILNSRGRIDRKKLAGIVFKNRRSLKKLCAAVHPYVIDRIRFMLKCPARDRITVIDAPLLIEARLERMIDVLVVVSATRKNQIRRGGEKFRMTAGEVRERIDAQMPLKEKVARADFVIYNNGDLKKTRKQVEDVWRQILWT